MCTQCCSSLSPLKATTRRLPMPAQTCFGTTGASAFITVSASCCRGRSARWSAPGRSGWRASPRRDDLDRAGEAAVLRDVAVDRRCRAGSSAASARSRTSTVPSSGMLIGLSGTCGAVPVRSTVSSSPATVIVTAIGRSLARGVGVVEKAVDVGRGACSAVGEIARSPRASGARSSRSGPRRRR